MRQTITRSGRHARPSLEGLEGRLLLSAARVTAQAQAQAQAQAAAVQAQADPSAVRTFSYTTPQGAHVTIQLFGVGTLAGTTVDPDGALNLRYSGTNAETAIVGNVSGGNGHAPLRSFQDSRISAQDLSGIGASPLAQVHLKNFDLVDNGEINLEAGVQNLLLNSVGANSELHLRALPPSFTASSNTITGETNGVTVTYTIGTDLSLTLTSVSGQFTPGLNLVTNPTTTPSTTGVIVGPGASATVTSGAAVGTTISSVGTALPANGSQGTGHNPGPPPAPPGLVLNINHIRGVRTAVGLGDPMVFGVDPVANALIQFDASTGAPVKTIPLPASGTPAGGVALSYNGRELVALVNEGSTILAYDAVSGAFVGQFGTASLAANGLPTVDGIGSTDTRTVVVDTAAGGGDGTAQIIDVARSLASGQAVAVGSPFTPSRQFMLTAGLGSVPASNTLFATGAAFFDTFQPGLTQFGILSMNTRGDRLSESARTELLFNGKSVNTGSPPPLTPAFGSVDQQLALVTGVSNGHNVVTQINPNSLSVGSSFPLDDPNQLIGLTRSFRPDLVGSALVDIQGNVQSVRAQDANGLVLNDTGNLNLVKVAKISNSVIIGQPFGHPQMPNRSNVTILSTARIFADRGGVTVVPHFPQIGPLSLPS